MRQSVLFLALAISLLGCGREAPPIPKIDLVGDWVELAEEETGPDALPNWKISFTRDGRYTASNRNIPRNDAGAWTFDGEIATLVHDNQQNVHLLKNAYKLKSKLRYISDELIVNTWLGFPPSDTKAVRLGRKKR